MQRLFAAAVLAAVLGGCATPDVKRPVAREEAARIKKIGVASFLGDTVYGISVGTTAFSNAEFSAAVPDWKVDSYAVSQALAILGRDGRFAATALNRSSYSEDQLAADKGKLLWDLAASQGIDTLVILSASVSDRFQVFKPGYGIFERAFLGISHRCLYAAYQVDVYDVAARKRSAWQWGGDDDTPCQADSEQRLPFKPKFEAYSDTEQQAMREGIEARIAESLDSALNKLELASQPHAAR